MCPGLLGRQLNRKGTVGLHPPVSAPVGLQIIADPTASAGGTRRLPGCRGMGG